MKNIKLKFLGSIFIIIITLISNTNILAMSMSEMARSGDINPITEENEELENQTSIGEIHEGDLYIFGNEQANGFEDYIMNKNVDGNVFIFGNNVKITGKINGSLYVVATNLIIDEDAYIGADVFALAENVKMSGNAYTMYVASSTFEITEEGEIFRDLKLISKNVALLGNIGRDINMAINNAIVSNDEGKKLTVGGNMSYLSEEKIEGINNIEIKGKVNFIQKKVEKDENDNSIANYIFKGIESSIFALIIYIALTLLAPDFIEKAKEYISTRTVLSAAIGLAFTLLAPIIVLILICTIMGIPIAFTLLMLYIILLMTSSAIVSIVINEFIANKNTKLSEKWKKACMIIPVSIAIYLLKKLPYIGGCITAIVLFIGIGIVITYQLDKRKKE